MKNPAKMVGNFFEKAEKDDGKRYLAIGATAITLAMGGGAIIGINLKDDHRVVDDNRPAKIINIEHHDATNTIAPVSGGLVPFHTDEEWQVTVQQCQPGGEDCAAETLAVPAHEYQQLHQGETIIPAEVTG